MKIVGFCGRKRSGKDTAAAYLLTSQNYIKLAFADGVRKFVEIVDPYIPYGKDYVRLSRLLENYTWEELKLFQYVNVETRRLQQVVGTEVGRDLIGDNIWIDILEKEINRWGNLASGFAISDVRFPNEAEWIRSKGGIVVKLYRNGIDMNDSHRSETEVDKVKADFHIQNNGDVKEFYESIENTIGEYLNA